MPLYSDNDHDVQSEKALRAAKRELDLALRPNIDHEGNRNRVSASKEAKKKAKLLKKQQRRQAS